MSTSIGSNLNYRGPEFLDARQGAPKTLSDLKNWNTLVPEGFQVFVDGCWYVYYKEINDPTTGHFTKMFQDSLSSDIDSSVGLSLEGMREMRDELEESLEDLAATVWPLEYKLLSGGGTYQKGQSIVPSIIWELKRRGSVIVPATVLVNGSANGVNQNKTSYTGTSAITTDTNYNIVITVDKKLSVTSTVSYKFDCPRFFGVSNKATLTSADVISFTKSDFQKNLKLSATSFNCTGGKYPWLCFPESTFNSGGELQVWIGGLRNTDLVRQDLTVVNNYKHSDKYVCYRLGSIQTGNISIELK